ncbi:hypothetical protein TrST_g4032 [Triparma strigata]|uniref:Uncharacterized protein n=1 Tax=Triparma strigata TaxID=1606541 RepID=A0A9W7EXK1_9STRA|nr:hypothetical protein TrST_g4032 [Triparma strigata]
MGITTSIPVATTSTCVVVKVKKGCNTRGPTQTFPETPFPLALHVSGVFESDYIRKAESFNRTVNSTLQRSYTYLFFAVIFSAVFSNIGTRALDLELPLVLTLTYIPVLAAMFHLFRTMRSVRTLVTEIFKDWRGLGIETDYFMGGKHQPARVGFTLTGESLRRQKVDGNV